MNLRTKICDDYRIVVHEDNDLNEYEYWWPIYSRFCWMPTEVQEGKPVWFGNIIRVYVQIYNRAQDWSGFINIRPEDLTMMELQYATR